MRLTDHEIAMIKQCFQKTFTAATDHLWLFGSRVDDNKRGGDIDLYVETMSENSGQVAQNTISFEVDLWKNLDEQKVDVVVNQISSGFETPIFLLAKKTGIQLI